MLKLVVKESQRGDKMRLSDMIEDFIKKMLLQQSEMEIQLQRNELAEYFGCSPSQINYVLSTRFTPDHGYIIKSTRGGGGCIHIYRISNSNGEHLKFLLNDRIGESLSFQEANNILSQLEEREIIDNTHKNIILSALSNEALSIPFSEQIKNQLRARILKKVLEELLIIEN